VTRSVPWRVDLASLLALKIAVGASVLCHGFSHVSDDDYSRVVIAEHFAHAPSFDPSGTSWLPFPFWANGTAMLLLGRSLAVAGGVAWIFGLASVAVAYVAMRGLGASRGATWLAVALAMTTPWNAWLGVATVPEALTAALIAAGAMTIAVPRARILGAIALLVASLSRYEAWPVCAVFAAACLVSLGRAPRGERTREGLALSIALLGPCVWMGWNAHAHGSALHFLARVARFRRSLGVEISLSDRLGTYPRALVTGAPEIALIGLAGWLGGPEVLARWRAPLAAMAALLLFLIYGDLHDGAPTHHPERALLACWWVLAGFGVDGARAFLFRHVRGRPKREAWAVAFGVAGAIGLSAGTLERAGDSPGRSLEESRDIQIERGLALRAIDAAHVTVVPCAYEHFALVAAFGAPERVTTEGPTHRELTRACPQVVVAESP
jgi:hypothetical protein